MWQLSKPENSTKLENLILAAEWQNIVIVCSAGLTFWQCKILTSPVGCSQSDSDSHQNPGWNMPCKHAVPGGTMCTCRGQLFSNLIPKYMAFILQGVIKLPDPVCPCMKREYLKQVEQIFADEVSKLHEITGKTHWRYSRYSCYAFHTPNYFLFMFYLIDYSLTKVLPYNHLQKLFSPYYILVWQQQPQNCILAGINCDLLTKWPSS